MTAAVALGAREIVVPPIIVSPDREGEGGVVPPITMKPPGVSVWLSIRYWFLALGVIVWVARVRRGRGRDVGDGVGGGGGRVVVLVPMMRTGGWVPDAGCRITGVLELMVRGVLGERVWPARMYWDWGFVVRVWPFRMIGVGVGVGGLVSDCGDMTGSVVMSWEPWALVDVMITPGACDVVTMMEP